MARVVGWNGPIIAHFVLDGIPNDYEFLQILETVQAKITPTHTVARYLETQGIHGVVVAPHGADPRIFKPLENRTLLRQKAGIDNKFVVGMFGRNNERKQQPRVMMALSLLKHTNRAENILLYLHCQTQDDPGLGGWNLVSVAKSLDIEELVIFPEPGFDQLAGVNYHTDQILPDRDANTEGTARIPKYYNGSPGVAGVGPISSWRLLKSRALLAS